MNFKTAEATEFKLKKMLYKAMTAKTKKERLQEGLKIEAEIEEICRNLEDYKRQINDCIVRRFEDVF